MLTILYNVLLMRIHWKWLIKPIHKCKHCQHCVIMGKLEYQSHPYVYWENSNVALLSLIIKYNCAILFLESIALFIYLFMPQNIFSYIKNFSQKSILKLEQKSLILSFQAEIGVFPAGCRPRFKTPDRLKYFIYLQNLLICVHTQTTWSYLKIIGVIFYKNLAQVIFWTPNITTIIMRQSLKFYQRGCRDSETC